MSLGARVLTVLVVVAIPPTARAEAAAAVAAPANEEPLSRLDLALSAGSGSSPLGHVGLELGGRYRRFEGFVGIGMYVAGLCLGEDPVPVEQCAHPVGAFGVRYAAFRRAGFELAPGLGLSFMPAHDDQQVTRPAYGTITWDWRWHMFAPRLNADLAARYRVGPWFYSLVVGAGVMVAAANDCTSSNMGNTFPCSSVPSPAYAAPTPFAITAYGQVVIGRGL